MTDSDISVDCNRRDAPQGTATGRHANTTQEITESRIIFEDLPFGDHTHYAERIGDDAYHEVGDGQVDDKCVAYHAELLVDANRAYDKEVPQDTG